MSAFKLVGLFLCCAFVVSALPANSEEPRSINAIQTEDDLLDSIYHDCMRKDTISCLKLKVYNYVDKMLDNKDTITVINGVQIVKTGVDNGGAPRAITSEDTIESLLFGRFARFLENHTLKVDLKGSDIVNAVSSTARSLSDNAEFEEEEDNSLTEEGRGKKKLKKKKKGLLRLIMGAGGIISAIIGKLALIKVALIAKKALIIAKIAFLLSAFLGIKKLLASKGGSSGKHTTIDAYPAEHHSSGHHDSGHGGHGGGSGGWSDWSSSGSSGSGGWGRSLDAQQLAYNAYPQAR